MTSITGTMGHRCLHCRLQEMSLNLFILVSSVAGTSLLQYSYTGQSVRLQRDVVKEGINKKVRQKEMIRQTFFFFFYSFTCGLSILHLFLFISLLFLPDFLPSTGVVQWYMPILLCHYESLTFS